MSTNYQTIVYRRSGGAIVAVNQNLYIKSKTHLAQVAGEKDWRGFSFLYFPYDLIVDPNKHTVRQLTSNFPPSLCNLEGMPLDYEIIIHARRAKLESGVKCLVEFEGGMGDQLMEAAAVMTAMEVYPGSEFAIQCAAHYVDIVRSVPGIPRVAPSYVGQARDQYNFTVSNHTNYISDPRGGMYGKASLYGAWLGLDRVSKVVSIKLSPTSYQSELIFLSQWDLTAVKFNFMIQFRSGSGHAKSWQGEKVVSLAELLRSTYDCNVFVVGKENELQRGLPHLVDLTGRSTWWQTCLLESNMSVVIGIDSGVMHLARSLGIPYVAMWGGTNAQCILGEDEGEFDIRLPLDCRDVVCFDCQRKTNACMDHITPAMVMEKIHLIVQGGRE